VDNVLQQLYRIFFSVEFLGNPVSLVGNLGSGVKDFFYEVNSTTLLSHSFIRP
jgi:hypothetical protein